MNIVNGILNKILIERDILPDIIRWIPKKEAVILLGSRQVGKTSLLYLLIQYLAGKLKVSPEDIFYLDLEIWDNLELLNKGVDKFISFIREQSLKDSKKYVFIDEIHYLDNPSNLLKILVDHYSDKIKIFASGSSALTIKKKFKDSLVGRKIAFEIYSLNFKEFLEFKGEKSLRSIAVKYEGWDNFSPLSDISRKKFLGYYFEYALFGGYPAVVLLESHEEKKKYLNDIYTSYVRKDINTVFPLENITSFNNIVKFLALNIGNLINIQEISRDFGLARQTARKYFSLLENTFICRFIQPYFTNKKKEIVKMPKVYFYDTGLRNRVINDFRPLEDRVDAGHLIENAVFKNLLKRAENKENIKYWRMKYGVEVDFVIDEGKIIPIEVKSSKIANPSGGILSFLSDYAVKEAILANKEIISQAKNIKFLPFYII